MTSTAAENMEKLIRRFLDYLFIERSLSENTISSYRSDLSLFAAYLKSKGAHSAEGVKAPLIVEYLAFCKTSGLSPRTVSRYLSAVRAFFRYLIDEGILTSDPTVNLGAPKIVNNPPEYLTLEEVELLLEMPDRGTPLGLRDRTIIELIYSCGLRVSEAAALTLSSINFHERCLLVFGKGKKERIVPFGSKAEGLLKEYVGNVRHLLLRKKVEDALFLNFRGDPLDRKGIWKLIKGYALRSGIRKNIKPHILRHSFGAHLIQNGADLRTVQELLGHADIATTQIYTHLDRGTLIDVHKKYHPLGKMNGVDAPK